MSDSTPSTSVVRLGTSRESVQMKGSSTFPVDIDDAALSQIIRHRGSHADLADLPGSFYLCLEQVRSNREGITLEIYVILGSIKTLIASEGLYGIKKASTIEGQPGLTLTAAISPEMLNVVLDTSEEPLHEVHIYLTTRLPHTADATLTIDRAALYYDAEQSHELDSEKR